MLSAENSARPSQAVGLSFSLLPLTVGGAKGLNKSLFQRLPYQGPGRYTTTFNSSQLQDGAGKPPQMP